MKKLILMLFVITTLNVIAADKTDKLSVTIIGSGSPVYNKDRAGASVLIASGKDKILLDMGNGTQANLDRLNENPRDFSALLFTHHHLDHNEEFVPLLVRLLMGRNDFTVIGPPGTEELTEANLELYKKDIEYRLGRSNRSLEDRKDALTVKNIVGGETFSIGDIKIKTLEVPHTIHTIAYRFEYLGDSVVITGDLTYTDSLSLFAKNADFMVIDSGGMIMKNRKKKSAEIKKNGKLKRSSKKRAHLTLDESSKIAADAAVKNLVYTHFNKGVIDEKSSLEKINKNYSGRVILGEDLMKLKISE